MKNTLLVSFGILWTNPILTRYEKNPKREMLDVIFGPFFICDCSGEDYGSLNQEQIDRFMKQFRYPEQLIRLNGELMSIPYKPEPKHPER